jgi:hypothetical protein
MAILKFEIYINDELVDTIDSPYKLMTTRSIIDKYLDENPSINRKTAKINVRIVNADCKGCGN